MNIFLKTTKRNRTFFRIKHPKEEQQTNKTRGFFALGLADL